MTDIVSALVQDWPQFKIRTQLRQGEIDNSERIPHVIGGAWTKKLESWINLL